jgi:hypothetical protein
MLATFSPVHSNRIHDHSPMRSEEGPRVLRVCGAAALVVLVSPAGLCCGGEARPEGLVAFSHGVGA